MSETTGMVNGYFSKQPHEIVIDWEVALKLRVYSRTGEFDSWFTERNMKYIIPSGHYDVVMLVEGTDEQVVEFKLTWM